MAHRTNIVELLRVEVSDDGGHVTAKVLDGSGTRASLSFPVRFLADMLATLPTQLVTGCSPAESAAARTHTVSSWSIEPSRESGNLILTLLTRDGGMARFALRQEQIAGIATLATYGTQSQAMVRTLN